MRKPNTNCTRCGVAIYKRPAELKRCPDGVFCSKDCYHLHKWGKLPRPRLMKCVECGKEFTRMRRRDVSRFCSVSCANRSRKGIKYNEGKIVNTSQARLQELRLAFGLDHCMVEECLYNKTYDVHRFIPGHGGGKYEIGNMFAICPNHHAEHTRKIIDFVKVSDNILGVIEKN
jgi:hypothetical protein